MAKVYDREGGLAVDSLAVCSQAGAALEGKVVGGQQFWAGDNSLDPESIGAQQSP